MRFARNLLGLTAVCAAAAAALAQDQSSAFLQQQRRIGDKLDLERRQIAPADSILDWQWGGWLEYYYFNFDDGVQASRELQRPGLALWTRLTLDQGIHEFFARMRMTYSDFRDGDEYLRSRRSDWNGPRFDRAWYQVDLLRALRLAEPADRVKLSLRAGRQPVIYGTGYALDLPLDAVTLTADIGDLRIEGLYGKTIPSFPNIDRSDPVDSHSDRRFYGVQMQYTGWQRHVPFAYAIWNDDKTDERPTDPFQNYAYDTFYFGFGARGSLAHNLNYWAEGVFESGRSFGDGMFLRRDVVEAWGWDAGVEYLFDHPTEARIAFEYMFASGDSDRRFSPTNAAGGNRGDREDTSFNAFGFRDTGLALGPTLSNLHIWKVGGAFKPLPNKAVLRDIELGTNWFLYHKHRSNAAISDFTADTRDGWVGWEMDYFLNWRVTSDVSWTVRWGTFFPGSAYSTDDCRHFFFTGVTWSF